MRGLTGQEDAAADRLAQYLARGLSSGRSGRDGAEHPRLVVPARGVAAFDCVFHVRAVETAQPVDRKIDHRRIAFGRQIAPETSPDVDDANRGTRHVAEEGRGLPAIGSLED